MNNVYVAFNNETQHTVVGINAYNDITKLKTELLNKLVKEANSYKELKHAIAQIDVISVKLNIEIGGTKPTASVTPLVEIIKLDLG